jgi:hypothetical protein
LLERRARRGERTPAWDDKPELYEDLGDVWKAFSELHLTRQSGFGPSALSPTDVLSWMKIHGYTETEDCVNFYELILAMDVKWLEHAQSKISESKSKENTNADTPGRNRRKQGASRR